MIAPLSLFEFVEIIVEFLLRVEARPVDALHLRIAFLALPVRARDAHQLECANAPGGRDVRPAAEIDEFSGGIERHHRLDGALLDQFAFEALVPLAVELKRLGLRQHLAFVGDVLRGKLAHFFLDACEVLWRKRLFAHKIVEEAGVDRRADAELDVREKFEHRRGEQMRRRVAQHLNRLRIFRREDREPHVVFDRCAQIDKKPSPLPVAPSALRALRPARRPHAREPILSRAGFARPGLPWRAAAKSAARSPLRWCRAGTSRIAPSGIVM